MGKKERPPKEIRQYVKKSKNRDRHLIFDGAAVLLRALSLIYRRPD